MKLTRAGLGAGVLTAAFALAACSSSGGSGGGASSAPATGDTSSTTAASTSAATSTSTSASTATSSPGPVAAGGAPTCSTGTLNAEGSTAQANAMTAWINAYTKACSSAKINYNPTGSGPGVSQFNAGKVDFAGSDSALDPTAGEVAAAKKQCGSAAFDLPMVVGPIALGYKLNGVNSLTLTPTLVAKIFSGKITTWNDPAIAAKNAGAKLPSSKINVVYRSDASGTTANFEKFLAATDPADFTAKPAKDNGAQVFKGQGAAKSQGVAQAIGSTDGSIGYVEYSFAANASLNTVKLDSGSGPVDVSAQSASVAAGDAAVTGTGGDLTLKLNYKSTAKGAYPMVLVTYEIVCSKYKDATKAKFVKNFLTYTAGSGQTALPGLGYAPLPSSLKTKVAASVAQIS